MRWGKAASIAIGAVVLVTAALLAARADDDARDPCANAGFSYGSVDSDGTFFAVVPSRCVGRRGAECTARDSRGPISRERIPPGIVADCVAFNQFLGIGVAAGTSTRYGECAGVAEVRTGGAPVRVERADSSCPAGRSSALPRRKRERATTTIEARARDPVGAPPAARQRSHQPPAPPWGLLVWRSGRWVCFEPGQIINARRFRNFAAVYRAGRQGESLEGRVLGSLRPDAKFGVGRQFFDFGRFLPYPIAEGGTCGLPGASAGLTLSRETLFARRDLGPARAIVAGVAGPEVRRVELGATQVPLSRRRAFLVVRRGRSSAHDLPLVVRYRDGTVRRF